MNVFLVKIDQKFVKTTTFCTTFLGKKLLWFGGDF